MVSFCTRKYCSMKVSCPPQSHRLRVKVPMNLNLCYCRYTVYPIFWVSLAGKLAKITECIEVLPAPEQPISSIFFITTIDFFYIIGRHYSFDRKQGKRKGISQEKNGDFCDKGDSIIQTMENLQLREGSSRRNNAFRNLSNNTSRSFISTALGVESPKMGDELRKSRIQNLPNYKKSSLGDNVNFIVVFQTIQIERLSRQVQLLRVKLRENERELFNAKNYEVQIRQLTEKCFHLEQQANSAAEEIAKLNKIAENLYNEDETHRQQLQEAEFEMQKREEVNRQRLQELQQEVERWKNRCQAVERRKSKDMEELKSLMENQRKSTVDREMREMAIRTQSEKSALENEIRKCKEMLASRDSEIDGLRRRNNKLEDKVGEIEEWKANAASCEDKVQLLNAELSRASQLLRAKDQELLGWKKKEGALAGKLKDQQQFQSESKYMKGLVEKLSWELEQAKSRSSSYEEEALRGKEMVHFVNELQEKLAYSTNETARISNFLRAKIEEFEKAKVKFLERENEFSRLKNLENEAAQAQARCNMMRAENERINSILKGRDKEFQALKKKHSDLQAVTTRYALLQRDKRALEEKYNNQLNEGEELKFAITRLEAENGQLRKYQDSYGEQVNKNALLLKELDRLNGLLRNSMEDLTSSKLRYSKMQESIKNYQDKLQYVKEYENRLRLLAEENQRLNALISNKNEDIQNLQSSRIDLVTKINYYKDYEPKISQYQSVVKKLNDNLTVAKRQLQSAQGRCRNLESKLRDVENNANAVQLERERLSGLNRNMSGQIEDYKNRCSRLQQECKKKAELDLVCQELHGQVLVYLAQLQSTEKKYKEYEEAYGREKKQNEELTKKIVILTRDLQAVTRELHTRTLKSREVGLEEKVRGHLQKVQEKDQQIKKLLDRIDRLQRECGKIKGDFDKLVAVVEYNDRETLALQQKVEQYKDYAQRISILASELDRLTTLNRGLEQDNKTMRLKYADNIDFEKRQQSTALMIVLMSTQLESLRSRVDRREVSLDQMRRSILQPFKKL